MPSITALARFLQRILLPGLGLLVILLAVLLSASRLLLPVFDEDARHWIERTAHEHGVGLEVGRLDLDWAGMGLRLNLQDTTLLGEAGATPLRLNRLSLTLDLPRTVFSGRLRFGTLEVEGGRLQILRDAEGRWQLQGLGSAASPGGMGGAWPAWMGMARRVQLVGSRLCLRDEASAQELRIEDIEAVFEDGPEGLGLALRMDLPQRLGGDMELRARMEGGLAGLARPSGQLWLSTTGLNLAGWRALLAALSAGDMVLPVPVEELPSFERGEVRGQAWIQLREGVLNDAQARLDLAGWRINPLQALRAGEREVTLHSRLDLRLRHSGQDWNLDLKASPSDSRQPEQRFSLRRHGDQLEMAGEGFDLDLLRPWLVITPILPADLRETLIRHRPSGMVHELRLHMNLAGETSQAGPDLYGHARFDRIGWLGQGYAPDIIELRGELWLAGMAALLHLDSPGLTADFHDRFREPLAFEQARGDFALFWADTPRMVGHGLNLYNRDLDLDLDLQLDLPAGHDPQIALDGRFRNIRTGRIPDYLPVQALGPETLAWLDRALPQSGGFVPEGQLRLHGDLGRFPHYDDGGGLFEVRFAFRDLKLDYAKGWRPGEQLHGELVFLNNGLSGRIDGGSIRGVPLREGWVSVPDYDLPRLDVRLALDGKIESMLGVLRDSPLIKDRKAFDTASLTGPAALRLHIDLGLDQRDARPDQAEGWIDLHANRLAALDQKLDRIQGSLHFVNDRLDARGIRALYREREASLAVDSEPRGDGFAYRIGLDTRTLASEWLPPRSLLAPQLSGEFPVNAELLIDVQGPRGRPVGLTLNSSLEGLAIDLPAPFGKTAEEERPSEARLTWLDGKLGDLHLAQPGLLDARLAMLDTGVQSGHIVLGEGKAGLPPGEGRLLLEGRLRSFDLDAWEPVFDTPQGGAQTLPSRIDLRAELGSLTALGGTWEAVQIEGQRDPAGWRLRLDSPHLAGRIGIPARATLAEPLTLDLDRLVLADAEETPTAPEPRADTVPKTNPANLPPMKIHVGELRQGELRLKEVQARTLPQTRGLLVQEIQADSGHLAFRGEGSWLLDDKNHHQTSLTLNLSSANVGEALGELGFQNTLRRGRLEDTQVSLRWADAPDRFGWAILEGEARFNVHDGALESVEPGAGRVLGLLSVAELPRRLLLDFGDVFGEGLRFDRIAANLRFQEGRAISELTQLNGPSAQIFMKGYSDMVQRTLNYDMVVVPALGNVLPIIGTVAGGPLVGGAVFLLQKIFDQVAGERSGFNYRITGSWDAPQVERVEAAP